MSKRLNRWPWAKGVDPSVYTNNTWPKISIVTPSFNQGNFIEETILSVLNQNYPNLEYIIIDGGSTDQTVDIIKKYEDKIAYWVSEPDRGQSHAINKGFEKCTGEIFNWLNSDDFLEPLALYNIALNFMQSDVDVLLGRERRIDVEGNFLNVSQGTTVHTTLSDTIGRCHIDQSSTYFRREKLLEIFPLNEQLHYLMDGEMWIRYLLRWGQDRVKAIDDILLSFRLHTTSKSVSAKKDFQIDKNTFENSLLKYLDISYPAAEILLSRPERSDYAARWNIKVNVEPSTVISHFALRSLQAFYLAGQYSKAHVCSKFIKQYNKSLYNLHKLYRFNLKVRMISKFPLLAKVA